MHTKVTGFVASRFPTGLMTASSRTTLAQVMIKGGTRFAYESLAQRLEQVQSFSEACLSDPAGNHGAARAAAVGGRDNVEAGGEAREGLGHIVAHSGLLARNAVLLRQRLRQPRPRLLKLLHNQHAPRRVSTSEHAHVRKKSMRRQVAQAELTALLCLDALGRALGIFMLLQLHILSSMLQHSCSDSVPRTMPFPSWPAASMPPPKMTLQAMLMGRSRQEVSIDWRRCDCSQTL